MFHNVHGGELWPNPACPDDGPRQAEQSRKNIIKFGHSTAGKQRSKCLTCGKTVTETTGTIFYRRRTTAREILDAFAQMAEGSHRRRVARTTGQKADPIRDWVNAAAPAETIEARWLADYQIEQGQLDGLWAYVGNKGEKARCGDRAQRTIFPITEDRGEPPSSRRPWHWQDRNRSVQGGL